MRSLIAIKNNNQSGDTIVEVMIAFAIFAAVLASSMAIMNLGIGKSMRSLEITQVRQQMDAQAEMIRFIHDSYVDQYQKGYPEPTDGIASYWVELREKNLDTAEKVASFTDSSNNCPTDKSKIRNAFFINSRGGQLSIESSSNIELKAPEGATLPPHSLVDFDNNKAYNMWVQAVPSSSISGGITTKYVDFHIRACWRSSGGIEPVTLGTIVRLYEPKV